MQREGKAGNKHAADSRPSGKSNDVHLKEPTCREARCAACRLCRHCTDDRQPPWSQLVVYARDNGYSLVGGGIWPRRLACGAMRTNGVRSETPCQLPQRLLPSAPYRIGKGVPHRRCRPHAGMAILPSASKAARQLHSPPVPDFEPSPTSPQIPLTRSFPAQSALGSDALSLAHLHLCRPGNTHFRSKFLVWIYGSVFPARRLAVSQHQQMTMANIRLVFRLHSPYFGRRR